MAGLRIKTVVLLGAGRMAWHLGHALYKQGCDIIQVYNRTPDKGIALAEMLGSTFIPSVDLLNLKADLVILALADSAVGDMVPSLNCRDSLVVHTSGVLPASILEPVSPRYGVFYPLQTFSGLDDIDFEGIPILIESSNGQDETALKELADFLSGNATVMKSDQRKVLHLAAVFVSNFPNFMYCIAEDILNEQGISFRLLYPLIMKTASNTKNGKMLRYQTGPAVRKDYNTLQTHLETLGGNPGYQEIYRLLTEMIIGYSRKNGKL